jgi:hypothetical protein
METAGADFIAVLGGCNTATEPFVFFKKCNMVSFGC